jgi:hypothetical protein
MAMRLSRIDSIDADDATTWSDSVFITIDLDWCADEVLSDTLDLLEARDAAATLFVTHDTPLLSRIRDNPRFEIGIHPNFNPLLQGDASSGADAADVIARCLQWAPGARSVRSHALVQSTYLLRAFSSAGLRYDCNTYIGHDAGIALAPLRHFDGALVRVPHLWEDDIEIAQGPRWDPAAIAGAPGLRVLDFHPIHIFLNTETVDRYEASRAVHRDAEALRAHVNTGAAGTRTLFEALLRAR